MCQNFIWRWKKHSEEKMKQLKIELLEILGPFLDKKMIFITNKSR